MALLLLKLPIGKEFQQELSQNPLKQEVGVAKNGFYSYTTLRCCFLPVANCFLFYMNSHTSCNTQLSRALLHAVILNNLKKERRLSVCRIMCSQSSCYNRNFHEQKIFFTLIFIRVFERLHSLITTYSSIPYKLQVQKVQLGLQLVLTEIHAEYQTLEDLDLLDRLEHHQGRNRMGQCIVKGLYSHIFQPEEPKLHKK